MGDPFIQTTNLSETFQALRSRDPLKIQKQNIEEHPDYKRVPRTNYAPIAVVNTGNWGGGMTRYASVSTGGTIYGQPYFFSPIHTNINWQIPSKRLEQYQWARFFYENEPKVGSAIDFYSQFPMSDWEHECRNRKVKVYFDRLKQRLKLNKWCRLISHEVHLLGDCFPFVEVDCPHCGGSGKLGTDICEHEGGTVRRIVILNPDYVEVHTGSVSPEAVIALRPDEELINMVQRKTPGYEKLSTEVIKLISAGMPIRLDNRNVSHLKYGECGYQKYGVGMVRRLFPILSYKTKLMVAQWIVAERLIVPIKIVKVGSDERPAGPADIAAVQAQLAATANDPNLTIVTHHAFDLDWVGASGKILTLSSEFEFINQEILDGMMINNALLNGEGPNFSSAAVGIEAMIQRLKTFRQQISEWILEAIYIPEAIRQGFVEKNPETGEDEVIIPKIKWNSMHLRDQQQDKTFAIQLYEKGLLSAQTVLELFDYDPDQEIERKRYDSLQMIALGQGIKGPGGGGGGMGGLPSLGGPMGGGGGGEPPIGAPGGGEMGGPGTPPGAPPSPIGGGVGGPPISKASSMSAVEADPGQFGGMVLKKKTRERIERDRQRQQMQQQRRQMQQQKAQDAAMGADGQMRDEKGRIVFTGVERQLIPLLKQAQKDGLLKDVTIYPQYRVTSGEEEYPIDFAIPNLKIGIEADGEVFHSSPQQQTHDKERDMLLAQQGWTVLRFSDRDIEHNPQQVVQAVIRVVMQKQLAIQNLAGEKEQQTQQG
jgi:very-short-patch-repair endonuclease